MQNTEGFIQGEEDFGAFPTTFIPEDERGELRQKLKAFIKMVKEDQKDNNKVSNVIERSVTKEENWKISDDDKDSLLGKAMNALRRLLFRFDNDKTMKIDYIEE